MSWALWLECRRLECTPYFGEELPTVQGHEKSRVRWNIPLRCVLGRLTEVTLVVYAFNLRFLPRES
jgi:hypothetical protein